MGAASSLAVVAPVFAGEAPDLNLVGKAAMGGNREKYQAGGFDTSKAASNPQFGPGGKNAVKNPFDGKFSDPAHSDLPRKNAKGGPEGVVVTALNNGDISFPDGN